VSTWQRSGPDRDSRGRAGRLAAHSESALPMTRIDGERA